MIRLIVLALCCGCTATHGFYIGNSLNSPSPTLWVHMPPWFLHRRFTEYSQLYVAGAMMNSWFCSCIELCISEECSSVLSPTALLQLWNCPLSVSRINVQLQSRYRDISLPPSLLIYMCAHVHACMHTCTYKYHQFRTTSCNFFLSRAPLQVDKPLQHIFGFFF